MLMNFHDTSMGKSSNVSSKSTWYGQSFVEVVAVVVAALDAVDVDGFVGEDWSRRRRSRMAAREDAEDDAPLLVEFAADANNATTAMTTTSSTSVVTMLRRRRRGHIVMLKNNEIFRSAFVLSLRIEKPVGQCLVGAGWWRCGCCVVLCVSELLMLISSHQNCWAFSWFISLCGSFLAIDTTYAIKNKSYCVKCARWCG